MAPKFLEQLLGVRRQRFNIKSAEIPLTRGYITDYPTVNWMDPGNWDNITTQGVEACSAVFQCMSTLAFGYPEPPPQVLKDGEPDPKSQLQKLLDRPNPVMSHSELMVYTMIYRAAGGNCYLHKIRNPLGVPIQLWPYNVAQMWPIPSSSDWVEEYGYYDKSGAIKKVPAKDVIHLKWPFVDLGNPVKAYSPLMAVFREVNTDVEATRMLYALLLNDAVMRGIITLPEGVTPPNSKIAAWKQEFAMRYGGDNRGGVAVLEQGATYQRVSLNMQELAFESIRRIPESRIAGAFRTPAILAGLYVGLEKATYANYKEARAQLTEDTFVPMWRSDGVELTQALAADFDSNPDRYTIQYDLSQVAALQENQTEKVTRSVEAFGANGVTLDEFRQWLGLLPVDQVIPGDTRGTLFSYELPGASTIAPPQPTIVDVTPQPPQLTDDQKSIELKARQDDAIARVRERMERIAQEHLEQQYTEAAAKV